MTPQPRMALIARDRYVDGVLDRLKRPDDLYKSPQLFPIKPGFYGQGGIGKTRLLQEIAQRLQAITPYVVTIDLDRQQGANAPTSPLVLLIMVINALRYQEQQLPRPWWQRWQRRSDPFTGCDQALAEMGLRDNNMYLRADRSHLHDINMTINQEFVPEQLLHAFQTALTHLSHKARLESKFDLQVAAPRPLVVLLFDTYEMATAELRQWLERTFLPHFRVPNQHASLQFVIAGRNQTPGLLEQPLPPLDIEAAAHFVQRYLDAHYHRADLPVPPPRVGADPTDYRPLIDRDRYWDFVHDGPLRHQLLTVGDGIPLLLQMLIDLTATSPAGVDALPDLHALEHDARLNYVLHHYLSRLSAPNDPDGQLSTEYELITQAAIPRHLPKASLLRALIPHLPGLDQSNALLYGQQLQERLARHSFVRRNGETLVYHTIVRQGILDYMAQETPDSLHQLHGQAADWFAQAGNTVDELYHRLAVDYAKAIAQFHSTIRHALEEQQLPIIRALLTLFEDEVTPTADDQLWLTFYRAELAWLTQQSEAAQQLLFALTETTLPTLLQEAVLARLSQWFDFAPTLKQDELSKLAPRRLRLLLWWSNSIQQPALQANALLMLGELALRRNSYAEAQEHLQAALALYQAIEDRQGQANALLRLGDLARRRDSYAEAEAHLQAALALYQALEERQGQANALLILGELARLRASYAEAHLQAALALYQALEDRHGQANALRSLGDLALRRDSYAEAQEHLQVALALYQALEDRHGQANALLSLGQLARLRASYAEAQEHLQAALALSQALEDRHGRAKAFLILGATEQEQQQYSAAQSWFAQAFAIYPVIDQVRFAVGRCAKQGHQAVDQAEIHQRKGSQELAQAALALAQFLLTTGEALQENLNPNLTSLRQRLTDFA